MGKPAFKRQSESGGRVSQGRVGARSNLSSNSKRSRKVQASIREANSDSNQDRPKRIVIDEAKGLVFESERDLFNHFLPQIEMLEREVTEHRQTDDIETKDFAQFEPLLQQVLNDPDEVWEDAVSLHGAKVTSYVGHYAVGREEMPVYYVALAYSVSGTARFVYLHFPSTDLKLVDRFRRGELVYDRIAKEVEKGALEGDALTEGDALAVGLYKAMLALRSPEDLVEDKFQDSVELREPTIEDPDEIWRNVDLSGNTLVTFVKHHEDAGRGGLWYIVVTLEDQASSSHALLFSFPTQDENLVDRYRHGENLQAEEVVQEASH